MTSPSKIFSLKQNWVLLALPVSWWVAKQIS